MDIEQMKDEEVALIILQKSRDRLHRQSKEWADAIRAELLLDKQIRYNKRKREYGYIPKTH